jgi:hypothetical protein
MAIRLRQVALVARELAPVVDELQRRFGLEVAYRDPAVAVFGLENAVLPVGQELLEVVAPTREGTAAGRYLDRRGGDAGYMVICQTDDHPPRRRRVGALGIRTVLDHSEPGHEIMQLHPADTGGSFLEIDWAEGATWPPAGDDWERAVRTDVVSGIRAVTVQAPDGAALAARWSEITEIDLDGSTLPLSGGEIRFASGDEGLVAVELASSGGAAEDATICGVRFTLT